MHTRLICIQLGSLDCICEYGLQLRRARTYTI